MIQQNYDSKTGYCFHILSGIFFFVAFSLVCRQWSGLLQLGSYFRAVYGRNGLILANILFAVVDIVAVFVCASSSTLKAYFESDAFEAITFIEGVRNCVYSTFLAYYGIKLVKRFWHFSRIERQAVTNKRLIDYILFCSASSVQDAIFTKVLLRMTSVLVLSSVCFLLRVCMLIAKIIAVHSTRTTTTPDFALFGFLWFCCSDFIPRTLPTMAFIFLMRTRKPAGDIRKQSLHKEGGGDHDDYQLVQVADDESFYNLSDLGKAHSPSGGGRGGGGGTTELMMNSDHLAMNNRNPMNGGTQQKGGSGGGGGGINMAANPAAGSYGQHTTSTQELLPYAAARNTLPVFDATNDDEDTNDDDYYSLDDDDWAGESAIIDKFFDAITFSATTKPASGRPLPGTSGPITKTTPSRSNNGSSREGEDTYDTSDMRV
jgi:hypothetical protein